MDSLYTRIHNATEKGDWRVRMCGILPL